MNNPNTMNTRIALRPNPANAIVATAPVANSTTNVANSATTIPPHTTSVAAAARHSPSPRTGGLNSVTSQNAYTAEQLNSAVARSTSSDDESHSAQNAVRSDVSYDVVHSLSESTSQDANATAQTQTYAKSDVVETSGSQTQSHDPPDTALTTQQEHQGDEYADVSLADVSYHTSRDYTGHGYTSGGSLPHRARDNDVNSVTSSMNAVSSARGGLVQDNMGVLDGVGGEDNTGMTVLMDGSINAMDAIQRLYRDRDQLIRYLRQYRDDVVVREDRYKYAFEKLTQALMQAQNDIHDLQERESKLRALCKSYLLEEGKDELKNVREEKFWNMMTKKGEVLSGLHEYGNVSENAMTSTSFNSKLHAPVPAIVQNHKNRPQGIIGKGSAVGYCTIGEFNSMKARVIALEKEREGWEHK